MRDDYIPIHIAANPKLCKLAFQSSDSPEPPVLQSSFTFFDLMHYASNAFRESFL